MDAAGSGLCAQEHEMAARKMILVPPGDDSDLWAHPFYVRQACGPVEGRGG